MATTEPDQQLVTPEMFVETYDGYADPWAVVNQYHEFQKLHASTDLGRYAIANRLDAPESRIRGWLDGARPDCVHGLQRAEERGWVPLSPDSEVFPDINRAVARIIARGSLDSQYVPQFAADSPDELEALFDSLDLDWHVYREETGHRGTEFRPGEDGAIFGRVLAALGVPVGDASVTGLPDYLDVVSSHHLETFVAEIIAIRGTEWEWADVWMITHRDRPASYLRSLGRLFSRLADGDGVEVRDDGVQIPTGLAERLLAARPL